MALAIDGVIGLTQGDRRAAAMDVVGDRIGHGPPSARGWPAVAQRRQERRPLAAAVGDQAGPGHVVGER